MTNDQLTAEQRADAGIFWRAQQLGIGDGGQHPSRGSVYEPPGRFGWDGGLGTSGYTDPREEVIGILLPQRMLDSPEPPRVFTDFWTSAYQATSD
jgi:CubicO group peptidase (beta-lactamase class C family)